MHDVSSALRHIYWKKKYDWNLSPASNCSFISFRYITNCVLSVGN